MRAFRRLSIAITVAAVAIAASAAPAFATGYWNVPSSFCQCVGCGWGAGYHAPLVLGPSSCRGLCAHNEVRLPYAPSPPCVSYYYGDCGGHCNFDRPSNLQMPVVTPAVPAQAATPAANVAPASASLPSPAPMLMRPIFAPPVEP